MSISALTRAADAVTSALDADTASAHTAQDHAELLAVLTQLAVHTHAAITTVHDAAADSADDDPAWRPIQHYLHHAIAPTLTTELLLSEAAEQTRVLADT